MVDPSERLEAENARLRAQVEAAWGVVGAAQNLASVVVTALAVFDDGEEEEMLVVAPDSLELLVEAIAALSDEGKPDE